MGKSITIFNPDRESLDGVGWYVLFSGRYHGPFDEYPEAEVAAEDVIAEELSGMSRDEILAMNRHARGGA